jgi:predicted ATPase
MKQFECFGLDTANQCLLRDGVTLNLPPKPFAVLRYLVEHAGRLITQDELLDALWPETYVQPQVLRTYMLELRKILGDDAAHPRFIQTLPKRGYRFVAAVSEAEAAPAKAHGPSRLAENAHPTASIVGRDEELALLRAQSRRVQNGQRQMVFITGEAGIGKTALVDAFCRGLDPDLRATQARGQCVQGVGGTEDYYPVMEVLSQLCAGPNGEAACRVLAARAPGWLANGHAHEDQTISGGRSAASQRTLGELCAALEELAEARPLVLIFEDLHWADEPTLHLISALARRRGPAMLLLAATCCPRRGVVDDSGAIDNPLRHLLQDLELRRLCLEIALPPLTRKSVAELLGRELGQEEMPAGLTDFVYRRSEGNPLFVIAVLEHLLAEGMLVRSAGESLWQQQQPWPEVEAVVPHQLARMIELEVERLTHDEQRLLEAASLMHVAFPAWAVAAALELDTVEVEEACDGLARRLHFVLRAGQDELPDGSRSAFYVFAHGLYRQVLYQRQSEARRARRHIRVAERLGALFAGREASVAREMGMHYLAAGDTERAARLLPQTMQAAGFC